MKNISKKLHCRSVLEWSGDPRSLWFFFPNFSSWLRLEPATFGGCSRHLCHKHIPREDRAIYCRQKCFWLRITVICHQISSPARWMVWLQWCQKNWKQHQPQRMLKNRWNEIKTLLPSEILWIASIIFRVLNSLLLTDSALQTNSDRYGLVSDETDGNNAHCSRRSATENEKWKQGRFTQLVHLVGNLATIA